MRARTSKQRMAERARYYAAKEAGLCVRCKRGKPDKGKATCPSCISYCKDASMKRYRRYKDAGMCVSCGHPSDGGAECSGCRKNTGESSAITSDKWAATGRCSRCGAELSELALRQGLKTCGPRNCGEYNLARMIR